jgi:putative exosortase-associated protein (TIGR04073 family)
MIGVFMKQVSLAVCCLTFALFGLSNAYSSDNHGYIQGAQSTSTEIVNQEESKQYESAASADTKNMGYEKTPVNKLGRGVSNILTFYLEIPASIMRSGKNNGDSFWSFFTGTFQGVFTSLYRGLTGVCDTITFFAPPYDKPLMEPEYAEESLSKETDKE